jgi:hypothetical protein
MRVGDLVIYKPHASTYEGTGLIHTKEQVSTGIYRYKISWPAKPVYIGKTMTWESPRDVEVISANRWFSEKKIRPRVHWINRIYV